MLVKILVDMALALLAGVALYGALGWLSEATNCLTCTHRFSHNTLKLAKLVDWFRSKGATVYTLSMLCIAYASVDLLLATVVVACATATIIALVVGGALIFVHVANRQANSLQLSARPWWAKI